MLVINSFFSFLHLFVKLGFSALLRIIRSVCVFFFGWLWFRFGLVFESFLVGSFVFIFCRLGVPHFLVEWILLFVSALFRNWLGFLIVRCCIFPFNIWNSWGIWSFFFSLHLQDNFCIEGRNSSSLCDFHYAFPILAFFKFPMLGLLNGVYFSFRKFHLFVYRRLIRNRWAANWFWGEASPWLRILQTQDCNLDASNTIYGFCWVSLFLISR